MNDFPKAAEHWRGRAEEARAIADGLTDQGARATMLEIAMGYDVMAAHAQRRDAALKQ